MPLACLELYIPWLPKDTLPQERLPHHDKWAYQEGLTVLLDTFCSVLFKVNKAIQGREGPKDPVKGRTYALMCGWGAYNHAWIQQRGIDVIVLGLLTLFVNHYTSESFTRLCTRVQEVNTVPSLITRIANSLPDHRVTLHRCTRLATQQTPLREGSITC